MTKPWYAPIIETYLFAVRDDDGTQASRDWVHMESQSVSFYMDLSKFLAQRLIATKLSLLDVGPRTGSGLALLRLIHHPLSYASLTFDPVSGIDLNIMFKEVAAAKFPDIEALHGDAGALAGDRKWDVVVSSHTIEHTDDPALFLNKLERLARKMIVVAAPYEEQPLTSGHSSRITYQLLNESGYHDMEVYRSPHWFNSLCVIAAKQL